MGVHEGGRMVSLTDMRALAFYRVLVVEDEYFLADDMAKALRKLGADVVGPAPSLRQGKPWKGGRRESALKPFAAIRRVRPSPGKGQPASRKRALRGRRQRRVRSVGSGC